MKIFPELPQDLGALSPEDLQAALAARQEIVKKVGDRDPSVLGDLTMQEVLDQLQAGVEDIEKIRAEIEARGEADQAFTDSLAKLAEKAGVVKAEADEPADDEAETVEETVEAEVVAEVEETVEEAAVEEIAEPVVASLDRKPLPKPSRTHQVKRAAEGPAFVAASGIPGFGESQALDAQGLAKAIIAKRYQSNSMASREKVIVASVDYGQAFPEERRLRGTADDQDKINAVIGEDALVASGGLCAPVTNYYDLADVSTTDRPVRAALAGFQATRGGLKFAAVPTLAEVLAGDAVGVKTADEDALGGTSAEKSCQIVECPSFSEVELQMIYHCVQFGNLGSRAWPEQVTQFNSLVMAAHARTAETELLDYISSTSTAVTGGPIYGAVSTLLNLLIRGAAGMRSRHRMRTDATIRVILPAWTRDMLVADLINGQFDRFSRDQAGVSALLSSYNIAPSWTLDGPTGGGQVFGAQSAGELDDFPDTLKAWMFPEGSYLFLDGGTLDLGIVRDSTLNNTNDFQIFGETFEAAAFIGVESLEITASICPDGTVAAPADAIACGSL